MASRLQRSYDARLRNSQDIVAFSAQAGVPHSAAFDGLTQPSESLRQEFSAAYDQPALPPTGLGEHGASTILVLESKQKPADKPGESLHGELVAAVADHVGRSLAPGVETLYIHASINPNFRAHKGNHERQWLAPVNALIENQGVPVIHTSIGWDDDELGFAKGLREQARELWNVTAFVVDSAGNHGTQSFDYKTDVPFQKHNAVSHAPPLVVHVGAASQDAEGHWQVDGYSSANSPTFLAPVATNVRALWHTSDQPSPMIGTSVAAPYASGVLAALNRRFGVYLTREQILYAVIATCSPVATVREFPPRTLHTKPLDCVTNGAGLSYNPEYAGFGLIRPELADRLLQQMVMLTQKKPGSITVPVEERVTLNVPSGTDIPDAAGHYHYTLTMPPGIALKTTVAIEFARAHGQVNIVSPGGTRLPMVMSKLPGRGDSAPVSFGLSTSHGWAGESLSGAWQVESTEPIRRLQMNQHHFMARDIVGKLDPAALLTAPAPDLTHARPLTDMMGIQTPWRRVHTPRPAIVRFADREETGLVRS